MAPDSPRFKTVLALCTLYCGLTALRLLWVADDWRDALDVITPKWVIGQLAALACAICIGYIYRGDREHRHRARASRRRARS